MSAEPRAQTLRFQGAMNRVMRTVLRLPGLSRLPGQRLLVIEVVGRRSGRRFEVPVAYTRQGADLLVGTPFGWGRNLRTGDVVDIILKGRRQPADVVAMSDHDGVVGTYAVMCRDSHTFAGFNKIALDDRGEPDPGDLELAWKSGARAFRLTPHGSS